MKTLPLLLSAVLLMAGFNGCNRSVAETGEAHADAAPAAHYKAGHGLQLTPAAARVIGLAIAEVGTQETGDAGSVTAVLAELSATNGGVGCADGH